MRINQVQYNYPTKAGLLNKNHAFSPAFTGQSPVNPDDLAKIVELIQRSDESRLDGTVQGLYQYGRFMAKASDKTNQNASIKEFFALVRLEQIQGEHKIAPSPKVISKIGERHFLVEEFIKGTHRDGEKLTLDEVDGIIDKLATMDAGGIVNEDLSPRNIMFLPDGSQKILDFDHFLFVADDGKVHTSHSTPCAYFARRIDKSSFCNVDYPYAAGEGYISSRNVSRETRFANSFLQKRKIPHGAQDLTLARNMSENPYIILPSNMPNYEAKTIYKKIKDFDVDDPIEFLRDYLQLKSQKYHTQMRDFLKTLEIPEDVSSVDVSFHTARRNLQNAIAYEEFLIDLFGKEKPDAYFAKLEAAKIQFEALLHTENAGRNTLGKEKVHAAYEKLIKVIMDGFGLYGEDSKYKKYLEVELSRYRDTFVNTDFSTRAAKKGVLGASDILNIWFSDRSTDIDSIPALRQGAKNAGLQVARSIFGDGGEEALNGIEDISEKRQTIRAAVEEKLATSGNRAPLQRQEMAIDEIVDDILKQARQGNLREPKKAPLAPLARELKRGETFEHIDPYEVAGRHRLKIRDVKMADAARNYYEQTYTRQKYAKQGGKMFMALAAIVAIGGYAAISYARYKKEVNKEGYKERINSQTNVSLSKIVLNSPFGKFLKNE